jgi:transposase
LYPARRSIEPEHVGLDDLVARLKVLKPNLIVLEATGGFETAVVAALAAAGLPVAVANPAQIRPSPKPSASAPRPTRSMPA